MSINEDLKWASTLCPIFWMRAWICWPSCNTPELAQAESMLVIINLSTSTYLWIIEVNVLKSSSNSSFRINLEIIELQEIIFPPKIHIHFFKFFWCFPFIHICNTYQSANSLGTHQHEFLISAPSHQFVSLILNLLTMKPKQKL